MMGKALNIEKIIEQKCFMISFRMLWLKLMKKGADALLLKEK